MAWRKPANIREWTAIFFRHKKKLIFPPLLVMITVVFLNHTYTERQYSAEALFQRQNDAALSQMGTATHSRYVGRIRQMMQEELRGRAAIERVIDDLNLTRGLARQADGRLTPEAEMRRQDLVNRMMRSIRVDFQIRGTDIDIVRVRYTDADRELVSQVANRLVENYIRETRRKLDDLFLTSRNFFATEVNTYQMKAAELERQKLRFELEHQGMLPNDPTSIQQQLAEARVQFENMQRDLEMRQSRQASLQKFVEEQPEWIAGEKLGMNPQLEFLHRMMQQLESEIAEHRRLGRRPAHPAFAKTIEAIKEIQAQIADTDDLVPVASDNQLNVARLEAQQKVEELSGEIGAIERRMTDMTARLESLENVSRNFFVIRSDYQKINTALNDAREQLRFWDSNLRQTVLALTAEVSERGVRLSIVRRAPEVSRPSSPDLSRVLMLALGAGLAVSLVLIVLGELLDHSFRSVEQAVDELKLPVLGAVEEIVSPATMVKRRIMGWAVFPSIAVVLLVVLGLTALMMYKSLEQPHVYENISPLEFIKQIVR